MSRSESKGGVQTQPLKRILTAAASRALCVVKLGLDPADCKSSLLQRSDRNHLHLLRAPLALSRLSPVDEVCLVLGGGVVE